MQPFMISEKDDDLLGVANRSDALGTLAVWSTRARDLVPHLTEQTTDVRGFQILVEAFRLWPLYEQEHSGHAGRLDDFFLLVEQAFARSIGRRDGAWPLPGARRVEAGYQKPPHISLADTSWHLLGGQKANGLWGLYRGAAGRAGLLAPNLNHLSAETSDAASRKPGLDDGPRRKLFALISKAMDGECVPLPTHGNDQLLRALNGTFDAPPLVGHFRTKLIETHALSSQLAARLAQIDALDHRAFMSAAAQDLPEHKEALNNSIRCENLLAVLESLFLCLCAGNGKTPQDALPTRQLDLNALRNARDQFANSGSYGDGIANERQQRFSTDLDTFSPTALAESILTLHRKVSDSRGRAAWVWEESGRLHSDMDLAAPGDESLVVGLAWRNDYYLHPLRSIARQLREFADG